MWKEHDDMLNLMNEEAILSSNYPCNCPVCNTPAAHLYLHRFEPNDLSGSVWAWCSNCMNYMHAEYKIPQNWNNLDAIDVDMLESSPEYLDNYASAIDNHINQIIRKV